MDEELREFLQEQEYRREMTLKTAKFCQENGIDPNSTPAEILDAATGGFSDCAWAIGATG